MNLLMARPSSKSASGRKRVAARPAEVQASALRHTRHEHAMETAQDYVEAIADLAAVHGEARAVDLARRLGVSHVTVIRTVARLQPGRIGFTRTHPSNFFTRESS